VVRLAVVAALALLILPATASAGPLRDCTYDHDLDRRYPLSELRRAIDEIPTDQDEYGLCREILTGAMHAGPEGGGGPPVAVGAGPTGSGPPDEQAQRDQDLRDLAAITRDAGSDSPGAGPDRAADRGAFDLASGSKLPTPVLVGLIALALVTIAAGVLTLRERPRSPSP
jgi:hypothetical protein